MEKVIWVRSNEKMIGAKENDGLDIVNRYLEEGWKLVWLKQKKETL